MEENFRQYELICFLNPDSSGGEILDFSQKISNFIKESGGRIERISEPKIKKFAFPVKKFHQGYLLEIKFLADPQRNSELERKLKIEAEILRFSIAALLPEKNLSKKPVRKPKIYPAKPGLDKKAEGAKEESMEEKIQKPKIKKEEKVKLEDIDKKLEEIIGNI